MGVLRSILSKIPTAFIVIDALDECVDREGLLKCLQEIQGWDLLALHTVVTSREIQEIEANFAKSPRPIKKISIQSAKVDADISTYVETRLKVNAPRWRNDTRVNKLIHKSLVTKADGMLVSHLLYRVSTLKMC